MHHCHRESYIAHKRGNWCRRCKFTVVVLPITRDCFRPLRKPAEAWNYETRHHMARMVGSRHRSSIDPYSYRIYDEDFGHRQAHCL